MKIAGPNSVALQRRARGPVFGTRHSHLLSFHLPLIQERQLSVTGENITDRPDMTIAVYRGCKVAIQQEIT